MLLLTSCYMHNEELNFYKQENLEIKHYQVYKYDDVLKEHAKTNFIYESREHTVGWDKVDPGLTKEITFIDINPNEYYYLIQDYTKQDERYFTWSKRLHKLAVVNRYSDFDLVNPIIAFLEGNSQVYRTFFKCRTKNFTYKKGSHYTFQYSTGCP